MEGPRCCGYREAADRYRGQHDHIQHRRVGHRLDYDNDSAAQPAGAIRIRRRNRQTARISPHIKNADYTRLVTQAATKPGDTGCPQWNAAEVALVKQSDFVPYYDSVAPTWTNKATYKDIGGGPVPTSLRLLAGQ